MCDSILSNLSNSDVVLTYLTPFYLYFGRHFFLCEPMTKVTQNQTKHLHRIKENDIRLYTLTT